MEYVEFKVGTKYESQVMTMTVVKKTYHFTTFEWVYESQGVEYTEIIRRKEQFGVKDNGWLDPATFTMMVKIGSMEIYASDFE